MSVTVSSSKGWKKLSVCPLSTDSDFGIPKKNTDILCADLVLIPSLKAKVSCVCYLNWYRSSNQVWKNGKYVDSLLGNEEDIKRGKHLACQAFRKNKKC